MKLNIDGVITELSAEEEALYNPEIPTIHVNGFTVGYYHYNEFVIKRIKNGVEVTETNVKGKNILRQTNQLSQESLSAVYIDENVCGDDNPIVYVGAGTSASVLLNSGTIDVYIR